MKFADGILAQVAAPDVDLIPMADAKDWLRVDFSDDDAVISGLVKAVTSMLDGPFGEVGKALVTQTWSYSVKPQTGMQSVRFPVVPFVSITSISYFDADNVSQSLTVGDFEVLKQDDWAYIRPQIDGQWPAMYCRDDALTITAVCGFGALSSVPESVIVAAKMLLASLYENRGEESSSIPPMIQRLIDKDRVGWVA